PPACFPHSVPARLMFRFSLSLPSGAPTVLYTLSLHDALPISLAGLQGEQNVLPDREIRDDPGDLAVFRTKAEPQRDGLSRRARRSEEHTSELQSRSDLVCRLLLEKKKPRTAPYNP